MSAFDSFMSTLFPPTGQSQKSKERDQGVKLGAADESAEVSPQVEALLTDLSGRPLSLPRGKPITEGSLRVAYRRAPSFASQLPWVEYLSESGCFLLEDGVSVGVVAEVIPVPTEGRSEEVLENVRDIICSALQDCLPEYDHHPWVLQLYVRDDTDPRPDLEKLRAYTRPGLLDTQFTQAWLASMDAHMRAIAKPGGLFEDDRVTQTQWRGQARRTRLVLYRRLGSGKAKKMGERKSLSNPEDAVNQVFDRLVTSLQPGGLTFRRYDGRDFHRWLMPRFNPRPRTSPDDPQRFYDVFDYPDDDDRLPQYDLSEGLLASSPFGDVDKGLWYFDGMPHAVVPVEEMRQIPKVGHITGEVTRNNGQSGGTISNALLDLLPEGTEACLTVVATPQEPLEDHIDKLRQKAVGGTVQAQKVREDCDKARKFLGDDHKLYQSSLVFYVNGADERELEKRLLELTTRLTSAQLKPVDPEDEVAALNSYLRWLPMAYDPELDRSGWYTQMNFVQHISNLTPLFGRARGTGNPGISFFNRGGGTFNFDPLNLDDRAANAHMLIFGPTGAGKSATLNGILSQVMAIHRPRLFVIEVGNSFGMLGDYFQRKGMTVNKVRLAPGSGACLPPFSEAHRLLDAEMEAARVERDREDHNPYEEASVDTLVKDADGDSEGDERDLMGEMEIAARLMITGGDPKEEAQFRRSDRRMVRDAIYRAARTSHAAGRTCLTEDVRQAFREIANDSELPESARERAYDMGESLGLFVDGFDGEVFNRAGKPWPECDVTIIDLAHYAREGYEAQLALAVISITNMITNLAEREQFSGRPIVQAVDESHIVTVNPLLSPFFVKVGKMGRKLSHWLWFATQNLEDFPNAAEKLLNMVEWWICLTMPPDEVEQVARFKSLTPSQRQLMLSATKVNKKYTEGVVLSTRLEALFRVVPPSLYLALAGTEGDEKAERDRVMRELKCSELDAAIEIARRLDEKRGIRG